MWELIQINKRKSVILFLSMGFCLIVLGYFIGNTFFAPDGGIAGIFIALFVWIIMSVLSYFAGDSILLAVSNAKEVSYDVHPQLFNIVEEMKIASSLPSMPKVYIINEAAPNAFATGIKPENSAIAVTAGLLSKLNRDELQGVIAHEMSHILNRDVLFMTFAGVLLGSITLISEVFLRSMWYSSRSSRRYRSDSKGGGQAQLIMVIIAIIFAILAPILAQLLYFAISRKREYLADASAVRLTRYPEGLASALEKISSAGIKLASANKATAPLYIINPLKSDSVKLSELTSTHPPISERIKILRSMMHGVNYSNYQKALWEIQGKRAVIFPESGLHESQVIPIRAASTEKKQETVKTQQRDIGDLIRAVNQYAFLTCICGLKIKIPPDFKKPSVACPRCKRDIKIPHIDLAAIAAVSGELTAEQNRRKDEETEPQTYIRKGKEWESFCCSCGHLLQVSPIFTASEIVCSACGKTTLIQNQ